METLAKYPYFARSGKRGVLRYRRSVPPRLRPIVGKREILISFGTADLAKALPQYHAVAAETEKRFRLAELQLGASGIPEHRPEGFSRHDEWFALFADMATEDFGPGPQAHQCKVHYMRCLAREQEYYHATLRHASADPAAFWRGEVVPLVPSREHFQSQPNFVALEANGEGYKYAHAWAHRRRLDERRRALFALARTVREPDLGSVQHCKTPQERSWVYAMAWTELVLLMDLFEEPALLPAMHAQLAERCSQPALGPVAPDRGDVEHVTLSVAARQWTDAHLRGGSRWSEERQQLCARVMNDFIAICGDKPISAYKKSDGRQYVAVLRRLPANAEKRMASLGIATRDLRQLAEAAEAKGVQPQDDANVNKKIGVVQQCFQWIMKHYDECVASPVDGMKILIRRSAKEERDPFTIRQLNTMFRAPLYTGCHSEVHWSRPGPGVLRSSAKFWIPLIALFSGMRSGEICQLTCAHIRAERGVHYFALPPDLRLKNDASVRSVPMHRALVQMGFLDFVASCQHRLFPDLAAHRSGRLSDGFGKHFARFLGSLGIKTETTDLHSFRHNFIAAADASGVEFSARERIVGHTLHGQAARYGKRYADEQKDMQLLVSRNAELQKLQFEGLDLDHLFPRL